MGSDSGEKLLVPSGPKDSPQQRTKKKPSCERNQTQSHNCDKDKMQHRKFYYFIHTVLNLQEMFAG